jgi:predicted metal-dependent enzyme (double-stranded beta helix superfamily)
VLATATFVPALAELDDARALPSPKVSDNAAAVAPIVRTKPFTFCSFRMRLATALRWLLSIKKDSFEPRLFPSPSRAHLFAAELTVMGDEFVLDTAVVRAFVADVQAIIATASSPEEACESLRPRFAELLADPDWLSAEYRVAAPESGMGGGIGQWLLYRGEDHSLSLFSLVVPPGSETPIHDHLAWGLVGLYHGEQDEEIYARRDGALELVERRSLVPGDFYVLIPPRDDIHRVRTTSADTSVSIHLLTNDTGCVWRHSFDPESGEETPFRSGYVNVACEDG